MDARELATTGPSRCLAGLVAGGMTVGFVAVDLLAAGAGDSLAHMVAVAIDVIVEESPRLSLSEYSMLCMGGRSLAGGLLCGSQGEFCCVSRCCSGVGFSGIGSCLQPGSGGAGGTKDEVFSSVLPLPDPVCTPDEQNPDVTYDTISVCRGRLGHLASSRVWSPCPTHPTPVGAASCG
jgi:hypothetical protein